MHLETRYWRKHYERKETLSILILRGCTLKLIGMRMNLRAACAFNPHFARMHLETLWNWDIEEDWMILSILILRGCTLKHLNKLTESQIKITFQSSFCEDAPWNSSIWESQNHLWIPFNPHFARMHLETLTYAEPSTDEDGLSILILRGCTLKLETSNASGGADTAFNPHFARMHLETPKTFIWYS